jgi:hypothetical protein
MLGILNYPRRECVGVIGSNPEGVEGRASTIKFIVMLIGSEYS